MKAIACCVMNFLFAVYLFYVTFTLKVKRNSFASDDRLTTSRIFLYFAFVAFFNFCFILLSILHVIKFAYVFGLLMMFTCGLASTYLISDFLLSLECKKQILINLFDLCLVAFAGYVSFMTMQDFSFTEERGYSIVSSSVFKKILPGFTWLAIFYAIYGFILPTCTFVFLLIKVVKEKDYPDRTFLAYFVAAIGGAFIYLVVILLNSFFAKKIDIYNAMFPFAFVIFAIILWFSLQSESLQKSFVRFVVKSFFIVVVLQGSIFAVGYAFSIKIPLGLYRFIYFAFLTLFLTIIVTGCWYTSKNLYGKYAAFEEFNRMGYRISEENKLLQYLQYYTENISDSKISVDYKIGSEAKTSDDILDFIKISSSKYLIIFGKINENSPTIRRSMLILKSVYRTIVQNCDDISEFVQKVNIYIHKNLSKDTKLCMFFGFLDLEESNLYYINCNMNLVVHYSARLDNVETFHATPCFLGEKMNVSSELVPQSLHFEGGDKFYVGSDDEIDATALNVKSKNSILEMKCKGE